MAKNMDPGDEASTRAAPARPRPDEAVDGATNNGEETQKESRRLLSTATPIPKELTERWAIPSGYQLHHTCWRDNALPHFQGRLNPNEKLDNKSLGITW